MNIKHNDIVTDEGPPFKNDALDREKYAKILTSLVSAYADGFVLAINNEWGTGKTTFVKMWQRQLKLDGFQTLYFNAWENDFEPNPLIALMAELKNLIKDETKEYKSLLQNGAVIAKNVLPQLLKAIAARYVDTQVLLNAIEDTTKGVTEILNDEIKEYAAKKDGLKEFRESLSKFVQATKGDKPIVFIIDELDRCRPNYAVELLEQIKHFFSVAGIVFVLSIDKVQLGHAVRGVYGNDRIDAEEYLRRFIDLEYSIPKPSVKVYSNYLFNYYGITEILSTLNMGSEGDLIIKTSELLFMKSNVTLRHQEKLFGQTRLILQLFPPNHFLFSHLLFILVFIKTLKNELYQRIEKHGLTLQELGDEFTKLLPSGIDYYSDLNIIHIEAELIYLYSKDDEFHVRDFEIDSDGNLNSKIKSQIEGGERNLLKSYFDELNKKFEYRRLNLKYLLHRINLTDSIKGL